MGGPIQVLPDGLLGVLQLKTGGKFPRELLETIQPTWDLENWYLKSANLYEFASATAALNAVGPASFSPLGTPANEVLAIHGIMIRTDILAAGEAVTFTGPTYLNNLQTTLLADTQQEIVVAAGQMGLLGKMYEKPLLLAPGWVPGVNIKAVTVQADFVASIWFTRLPY